MHGLEARFSGLLDAAGMAPPGSAVLIAVSGGADSVALLRLFCAVRTERKLRLCAAHLNHGIRGDAAAGDAAFVAALCESLAVPCALGERDVPALAALRKAGLEDAARCARYDFLEAARAEAGADCIALAHHAEDQAETVLLHLLRGSGLAGLTGMRPVSGALIRPLLGVHRQALRDYLRDIGQDWREDATNADPSLARNRLRIETLPALAAAAPNLIDRLGGMAARLALDEDCLRQALAALALPKPRRMPYGACWPVGALGAAHEALRRRALADAWRIVAQDAEEPHRAGLRQLEAAHIEALSALLESRRGAACNLPGGWRALRGEAHLHWLAPGEQTEGLYGGQAVPLRLSGETPLPDGSRIVARAALPGEMGDGARTQVLDAALLAGARVRSRRAGDRFHPLGAGGAQALKQTLIDRGVDRPFRQLIPLICAGERVLWILGLLPAQDAAVTARTERAVHFTYDGELPWR